MGAATPEQIESARKLQAQEHQRGEALGLLDALVKLDVISQQMRDEAERKAAEERLDNRLTLGNFRILKKLGQGGMGTVFLAEDTLAGRQVALKLLPRKYSADQEFISRFRREARAAGQLNHPNIVSAYSIGEERGSYYLAMEYCDGETLHDKIQREEILDWEIAFEITRQVALGLKHAHEQGFIHRDIKPANIFLNVDGTVKILDLGLSKNISSGEQTYQTQTGIAMGTPHFMSPEQVRGDKNIDGRTDIYSLGATLYQMLTGKLPFDGDVPAMVIVKHLTEQLPDPRASNPKIPERASLTIQKMMARRAADRYRDCGELLDEIERVLAGKPIERPPLDMGKSSVILVGETLKELHVPPKLPKTKIETRRPSPAPTKASPAVLAAWSAAGLAALAAMFFILKGKGAPEKGDVAKTPEQITIGEKTLPAKPLDVTPPSPPPSTVRQPDASKKIELPPVALKPGPVDDAWIATVKSLPVYQRVEKVEEKLRERNPGYTNVQRHKIDGDRVTEWVSRSSDLKDITALRALPDLKILHLTANMDPGGSGMTRCNVADLKPLMGMKLETLNVSHTSISDLTPLAGMPLETLDISDTEVGSLEPLRGMNLKWFQCAATQVGDLSVLAKMPLKYLNVQDCRRLETLAPLSDSKLEELVLRGTRIDDLTILEGMSLQRIWVRGAPLSAESLSVLRRHKTLRLIDGRNTDYFFSQQAVLDNRQSPP